jgi:hypothetical protein
MKLIRLAAASMALLLVAAAPAQDIASLGWIVGDWESQAQDGKWTVERWAPARGGVMMGTGLSGRGGKATSFEFMRIVRDESGDIAFWGSPTGAEPVPFRLVSANRGEIVFENPRHDYPQRIVYRLSGGRLLATVSLADGSRPLRWNYRRIGR